MDNLERLALLKKQVATKQREADKAEGALAGVLTQLREGFGCDDLEEAEALLAKLERQEAKAEEAFTQALAEFEEEWKDSLGGD